MRFLSASDIAKRWGASERSVRNYCAQGRVPGAFLAGKTWCIPENAEKPARSKKGARVSCKNVGEPPRHGAAASRDTAMPYGSPTLHDNAPASPLLDRLREEKASRTKGGIYHKVQVELTYNSNRIEGSCLSLDQTRLIFETATVGAEGELLHVDDIVETSNHFRAVDYIIDGALDPLSESTLKELHRILKAGTSDATKDWFNVGDYKLLPNEVAGRKTTLPEDVACEVASLLEWYDPKVPHSLDDIIEFHVRLERIHPFQDGNGRVGRLIMFKECLTNGIVPFIIDNDMKLYYYRGLSEWDGERGFLTDTCLAAQDRFKAALDYFRIPWSEELR